MKSLNLQVTVNSGKQMINSDTFTNNSLKLNNMQTQLQGKFIEKEENEENENNVNREIYEILLKVLEFPDGNVISIKVNDLKMMLNDYLSTIDKTRINQLYGQNRNFRKLCLSLSYQGVIESFDHHNQSVRINFTILNRMYNIYDNQTTKFVKMDYL